MQDRAYCRADEDAATAHVPAAYVVGRSCALSTTHVANMAMQVSEALLKSCAGDRHTCVQ